MFRIAEKSEKVQNMCHHCEEKKGKFFQHISDNTTFKSV